MFNVVFTGVLNGSTVLGIMKFTHTGNWGRNMRIHTRIIGLKEIKEKESMYAHFEDNTIPKSEAFSV